MMFSGFDDYNYRDEHYICKVKNSYGHDSVYAQPYAMRRTELGHELCCNVILLQGGDHG
jgi:hypothetical protein